MAGPGVGSFHCSWKLFLGPWQAGLGVLERRHLSESRRLRGRGEAVHGAWQVCMRWQGRQMCGGSCRWGCV